MSSTPSQLSIISHQFQQTGQFYPLPNYIKNYVDHILDQENLHLKIKNWKDSLEPFHHTQCSQPLLWIHQNEWQNQYLFNTITLMDATYKRQIHRTLSDPKNILPRAHALLPLTSYTQGSWQLESSLNFLTKCNKQLYYVMLIGMLQSR